MKKRKSAFTMVELVFVIVIIGILTAVTIPRLFMMRDDAIVSLCVQESTQFLSELSVYYTSNAIFTNVSKMTNLDTNLITTDKKNGFIDNVNMEVPSIVGSGKSIIYRCNGFNSVKFQASIDNNGTVWISTYDASKNELGIGKNLSKVLESKNFYKSYQVGGIHLNYGFKSN
jgi:prepilin-type N-terminal cleavage/methylation domain-containing protein